MTNFNLTKIQLYAHFCGSSALNYISLGQRGPTDGSRPLVIRSAKVFVNCKNPFILLTPKDLKK